MNSIYKYTSGVLLLISTAVLYGCESFTEVDQKGMNLLSKTSDLDLVLNAQYYVDWGDLGIVCNDMVSSDGYLPSLLSEPNKQYNQILEAWDEKAHATQLPGLTSSDGFYENCYSYIGSVANPVLLRVDDAVGSEAEKTRLKSEALTVRAYFHFLAAQKYARPYNPETADDEKCIAYVTEEWDIKEPPVQLTQKEVYSSILADLDKAIELKGLPEVAVTRMRMCAAMPHAVKAHVLMAMRDIDAAATEANLALQHGNIINDYYNYLVDDESRYGMPVKLLQIGPKFTLEEDYFTDNQQCMFYLITPYCESQFEKGHYRYDYFPTYSRMYAGAFDPTDPDKDREGFIADAMDYYGVPFDELDDMDGQNNKVGIKTTHMYLILAEAAIEKGNYEQAAAYLDNIRIKRIHPDYYVPLSGRLNNRTEAIQWLKKTAHGEYAYSMWNFFTRKRWTLLDDYKETFTREIGGVTYTLTSDSPLWIFPIPKSVMDVNPNYEQNYPTK